MLHKGYFLKFFAQNQALGIILGLQFFALLALSLIVGGYGWDDGAITLAFSRSFAQSGSIALTPISEQVEGFSSVAWFLINALVAFVIKPGFFEAILASQILSVCTLVASAWLLSRIAQLMGLSNPVRYAIVTIFAFMGPSFAEAVNGMEMGLFTFAGLLTVYSVYYSDSKKLMLFAITLLILARFEACFYLVFVLFPLLMQRRLSRFSYGAAYGLLVFAIIAIARWHLFGDIMPNTFYAKMNAPYQAFGYAAHIHAFFDLPLLFMPTAIGLLIWELSHPARNKIIVRRDYVLLFPIIAVMVFSFIAGKDWGYVCRIQFFAIPFALLLTGRIIDQLTQPSQQRIILAVLIGGLTVVNTLYVAFPYGAIQSSYSGAFDVTPNAYRETALAVEKIRNALALPHITFMTPDVGGAALCCPDLRIVDMALLTNHRMAKQGYSVLGDIIASEKPEVIEAHQIWASLPNLYELNEFKGKYRPALIDNTRLYLRNDIAQTLVSRGEGKFRPSNDPQLNTVLAKHRYVENSYPQDDEAFLSTKDILVMKP